MLLQNTVRKDTYFTDFFCGSLLVTLDKWEGKKQATENIKLKNSMFYILKSQRYCPEFWAGKENNELSLGICFQGYLGYSFFFFHSTLTDNAIWRDNTFKNQTLKKSKQNKAKGFSLLCHHSSCSWFWISDYRQEEIKN